MATNGVRRVDGGFPNVWTGPGKLDVCDNGLATSWKGKRQAKIEGVYNNGLRCREWCKRTSLRGGAGL